MNFNCMVGGVGPLQLDKFCLIYFINECIIYCKFMQSEASRAVASDSHGILLAAQQYVFLGGIVGCVSFDDTTVNTAIFIWAGFMHIVRG